MFKISFFLHTYDSLLGAYMDMLDPRNFSTFQGGELLVGQGLISRIPSKIRDGEGDIGLVLDINSKHIFGGKMTQAVSPWRVLLEFNNTLYQILAGAKLGRVFIYDKSFRPRKETHTGNSASGLYLVVELRDVKLLISTTEPVQRSGAWISLQNESVHMYQVIEEVIKVKKEYFDAFLKAVSIISSEVLDLVKLNYFNDKKILYSDTPWLPLEQAWTDYKQQNSITDKEVERIIADEETKEKSAQKKWWQVWR
ncbi:MAG: hypothetical protein Q7S66_03845 [bacterium]|nr:hypothetical protein [bacterium]